MFPTDNAINNYEVDPEAAICIPLRRRLDGNQKPYYIGKLQLSGTFNWDLGSSFKAYLDEPEHEELHILPLDSKQNRTRNQRNGMRVLPDRIQVDMHSSVDEHGEKVYVGEIKGPVFSFGLPGFFFTLFVSHEGREELQISKLRARRNYERDDGDSDFPTTGEARLNE